MKFSRAPLLFLFIISLFFSNCYCEDDTLPYLKISICRRSDFGFFASLKRVLISLICFENHPSYAEQYKGCTIDFGTKGLYYDPAKGDNWWTYYFEPVEIGDTSGYGLTIFSTEPHHFRELEQPLFYRDKTNEIIKKYFKPKPHVIDRIKVTKQHFLPNHHVIGIHYRGTDKFIKEAKFIAYQEVRYAIDQVINGQNLPFQIFVATDEQDFLDYMIKAYPGKILYQKGTKRSTDGEPIHKDAEEPYERGLEALVDSILLSKCDQLLRTKSALSLFSTFFNPDLPFEVLNP